MLASQFNYKIREKYLEDGALDFYHTALQELSFFVNDENTVMTVVCKLDKRYYAFMFRMDKIADRLHGYDPQNRKKLMEQEYPIDRRFIQLVSGTHDRERRNPNQETQVVSALSGVRAKALYELLLGNCKGIKTDLKI